MDKTESGTYYDQIQKYPGFPFIKLKHFKEILKASQFFEKLDIICNNFPFFTNTPPPLSF